MQVCDQISAVEIDIEKFTREKNVNRVIELAKKREELTRIEQEFAICRTCGGLQDATPVTQNSQILKLRSFTGLFLLRTKKSYTKWGSFIKPT